MTWAGWSKKINSLGVTTSKGALLLINMDSPQGAQPQSKADAAITCGCWNTQALLALAAANHKVQRAWSHLLLTCVSAASAQACQHRVEDAFAKACCLNALRAITCGCCYTARPGSCAITRCREQFVS